MLKRVVERLWNDDDGALIAIEFLFVATILIIGIIVGLVGLRNAVVAELTELGNAILALSQGFSFSGLVGCCSSTDGSQAIDIPELLTPPTCVPPAIPSFIDVIPCT
jgi:Flp pilus assembly pilin Flp